MQWITRQQWENLSSEDSNTHRICTGGEGWLDRYGDWVVETHSGGNFIDQASAGYRELTERYGFTPEGWLVRDHAKDARDQRSPRLVAGRAPGQVVVRERGVGYHVEPAGGYSTGLFLDQCFNRRWVMSLLPQRMLNLFAYTGSFSVCAALAGAETTSVDVAKRALDIARSNFELNGISLHGGHRFVAEDVSRYVSRLLKRGESFDAIVLDPPTFGRAVGRVFRLEQDLPMLVRNCWELLSPGGWMLVSCNYARWNSEKLLIVCRKQLSGMNFAIEPGELPGEIPFGAISWRLRKTPL